MKNHQRAQMKHINILVLKELLKIVTPSDFTNCDTSPPPPTPTTDMDMDNSFQVFQFTIWIVTKYSWQIFILYNDEILISPKINWIGYCLIISAIYKMNFEEFAFLVYLNE